MMRMKQMMHKKEAAAKKEHKELNYAKELATFFGTFMDKFHGVQLLHAEWGKWLSLLFLWIHFKSIVTKTAVSEQTELLIIVSTAARFVFCLRPFIGKAAMVVAPLMMLVTFIVPSYLAYNSFAEW